VLFSQYTRTLDLISDYLDLRGYISYRLDGSTNRVLREVYINQFNQNKAEADPALFLLSTRAGGEGVNLFTADTVILFDSDWNPQVATVLHCTVLYCSVLYYDVLYYTALYYSVLYYAVLHCTILYYTILYCGTLPRTPRQQPYCTMLYCTVLYCSTLPRIPRQQPYSGVSMTSYRCIENININFFFYYIVSHHIASYRIVSHRIVSYRILSRWTSRPWLECTALARPRQCIFTDSFP